MLWLSLHDSLPTKAVLHHRGMGNDGLCPRCNMHPETVLHCLRDCDFAQLVWRRLGFPVASPVFCSDLFQWLTKHVRGRQDCLFLSTIWWVWRWRNNCVFKQDPWHLDYIIRQILVMKEDFTHEASFLSNPSDPHPSLWWSPPPNGFSKLNTNGSFHSSMGLGGVMRDAGGHWLWGFSEFCRDGNCLEVELLALRRGLKLAWERGHRRIMCEVDSLEVIHLINRDPLPLVDTQACLLQDIKSLLGIGRSV
ncbi:Ribonuclease H-like superfamily [Sesbania bispinosa]|nr:Ribonuclease H-like superfamily [Sesbania bispinosa]